MRFASRLRGVVARRLFDTTLRDAGLMVSKAIGKIEGYTRGVNRDAFLADDKTIDAVVRNLEIIGEAARRMPAAFVTAHLGTCASASSI